MGGKSLEPQQQDNVRAFVRQLLKAHDDNQTALAEACGVAQPTISDALNHGKAGTKLLHGLARVGKTTIDGILAGTATVADGRLHARTVEHDPDQVRRYPNVWEGLAGESLEFRTFAEGRLADAVGTAPTRKAIAGLNYMTETLRRDYDGARYQPGELMASWREAMRFVEGWEPAEAPTAPAPEPRPEPKLRAPMEERAAALRATAKKRKR